MTDIVPQPKHETKRLTDLINSLITHDAIQSRVIEQLRDTLAERDAEIDTLRAIIANEEAD